MMLYLKYKAVFTLIIFQALVQLLPPNFDSTPYINTDNKQLDNSGEIIKVHWTTLMSIDYEEKYFEETEMDMLAPVFTNQVKNLDGKRVEVEGYAIPMDEKGYEIALSANPYASCFFCGQASPASVMSIYKNDKKKAYDIDEYVYFEGVLKLNYDDPIEFYYILEEAVELDK